MLDLGDPFPFGTERCPYCAEEILADTAKCRHCGEWLVAPPPGRGPSAQGLRRSYAQPVWQLVLLSVVTFGLYEVRWFYRTWKQLQQDRDLDMSPGLHALGLLVPILNIVLVLNLFREIKDYAEEAHVPARYPPGGLLLAFLAAGLAAWAPAPWWPLSLLSVVPLAVVQRVLNAYWRVRQPALPIRRALSGGQVAAVIVGGFFFAMFGFGVYVQLSRKAEDLVSRARTSAEATRGAASSTTAGADGLVSRLAEAQREAAARLPGRKLSAQELFGLVSPSLFVVTTEDSRGAVRILGSAVAVTRDLLVTNAHVVEGGGSIRVSQGEARWSASVVDQDRERDLCRLRIAGLRAAIALVRDSRSLRIGQRVYSVGAPEGLEMTLSEGLVSGFRDFRGQRVVQTSAPISHGSSGGGLFDEMGGLIGITTFMLDGGQNLNFAILAEHALGPASRPLSADELLAIWRDRDVLPEVARAPSAPSPSAAR